CPAPRQRGVRRAGRPRRAPVRFPALGAGDAPSAVFGGGSGRIGQRRQTIAGTDPRTDPVDAPPTPYRRDCRATGDRARRAAPGERVAERPGGAGTDATIAGHIERSALVTRLAVPPAARHGPG